MVGTGIVIGLPRLLSTGFWEGRTQVGSKKYIVRFFEGSDFVQRVSIFLATSEWDIKNWVPVVELLGKKATVDAALVQIPI